MTVTLGAVVATGVFGQLSIQEASTPDGDFAISYSEASDLPETDSFGHTGDPTGDGQARLIVETTSGGLDAEKLTVAVAGSEYNWAHHGTAYDVGETIDTGDDVSVWAERGDEIMVIWEDGTQSVVFDTFSIPERDPADGSDYPDPDEDCSWVESELGGSPYEGDLTIDGIVVDCDLDQYDVHKLEIKNGGAVIGEAEADGDIDMTDGTTYDGDVVMLSGGNDLDLDDESEINGDVNASGNVALDSSSVITGDVDAEGDVDVDGNSRIEGALDTTGNVKLNEEGSGSVTIERKVTADGDVDIYDGSTVQADVESTNSGSITLTDSTVLGAIATGEDVDVDGSTVEDDVYEDNGFSCDSSEIDGDDCGDYTPGDYDEY